jgi:NAD(P)-dependent dehydrogenase (short-subunit alcohol dehydrogenase family)
VQESLYSLADRVTIVTGAGRGIGKAIALAFARAGSDVVVTARTISEIEATAAEIKAIGRRTLAIQADVCDSSNVIKMVADARSYFGKVDILINNVGGRVPAPLLEMSEEVWDQAINLNLKSCFLCSKEVGQLMAAQRTGNIINISSEAAFANDPNVAHYGTAKAAVNHLTRALAVELAPYNVRVNGIAPGSIDVGLALDYYSRFPEQKDIRMKLIPMGRFGMAEEVARVAVFLASEASSYITGVILRVSGGSRLFG